MLIVYVPNLLYWFLTLLLTDEDFVKRGNTPCGGIQESLSWRGFTLVAGRETAPCLWLYIAFSVNLLSRHILPADELK